LKKKITIFNPATADAISAFTPPSKSEMEVKIKLSQGAFEKWKRSGLKDRQRVLLKISAALEKDKSSLARLLTTEQGKPLHESLREITSASNVFRYYSQMSIEPEVIKSDASSQVAVTQEPVGVCALILPWNYPVGLLAWKLAPCLLAGNTVIIKPSRHAPLTVGRCAEIASRCVPEGVVQVMKGDSETGKYLVRHKSVDKISFTGSVETGKLILASASKNLTKQSLELGGNDAAIILPDCDIEKRLESIFWGAFTNAGQICIAIKRLYVHESIESRFVKLLAKKAGKIKVGNGLSPGTQMGPLNNPEQLRKIEKIVKEAKDDGASIVCGGSRYSDKERKTGFFFKPTIITDIDDNSQLVREEQFGPVVPVLTYRTLDEAIERANSTEYGLGGSVWTENVKKGLEVSKRLNCGTVWLNAHMLLEYSAPFGGWKQSGLGRELGKPGLDEFLQYKTTYWKK
jgi:acyl-CoA reductase-like NAD-dependent aldehyde dehydrogenase